MMRKQFIAAVGISILSLPVVAQKSKVVTAYNYHNTFQKDKDCGELVKGVAAIEPATKDVKTKAWAKTWYYGANLFNAAVFFDEGKCGEQIPNALEKLEEYSMNTLKFNVKVPEGIGNLNLSNSGDWDKFKAVVQNDKTKYSDPVWASSSKKRLFRVSQLRMNRGVDAYRNEKFQTALTDFKSAARINDLLGNTDTNLVYNMALTEEQLGNLDGAIGYYERLIELKKGPEIYSYLATLYRDKKKDTAKSIELIKAGRAAYPEDGNLIKAELEVYLNSGKTQEALQSTDLAIEKNPTDPILYYVRGSLYDEVGELEKAEADYKKSVELKPDFFDASYNLGAMYYNEGVNWNNKANEYSYKETTKIKEAEAQAKEYFLKALPYLEKAYEMDDTDPGTISSLRQIYAITSNMEKYNALKGK